MTIGPGDDGHDMVVTSPANRRVKSLLGLRRRRVREDTRATLVEGYEEIDLAVRAGVVPRELYACPELFSPAGRAGSQDIGTQDELLRRLRGLGVPVVRMGRTAFEKVAYRQGPDGLLAVVAGVGGGLDDLPERPSGCYLVSQSVEKPGNLGAMLRTADAVGVDAVVAADPVTDWGNPNIVRASKATVFAVPVASASTPETLDWVRRRGLSLVVTTPDTDLAYTDVDYTGPVAVAVGAEKAGADAVLLDAANHRVRIPMRGKANSLNVASSAAVVLYEVVRQRTAPRPGC